ncbi:DDB1- and CUL4-associated factor 5-like [Ornithodoros turicata]|uniref:DDB1- and CUL4-associated factor 5-like n=1 Tax=Ornithodoros turicata TaxID=34597 RepID=UPI003138B630
MARGSMVQYAFQQQYTINTWLRKKTIRERYDLSTNLFRKDLYAHYGCVNAIEFSTDGDWLVSGGDDKRVLLWNIQEAISGRGSPRSMKGRHNSNIFCLSFDSKREHIFSAGNDEQVLVHDVETGATMDVFMHGEAVYGLSVEPTNDFVFASACDDGRILIYDIREPSSTDPLLLVASSSAFHAVTYNPQEPRLLATANSKEGAGLWDVRKPRSCLLRYGGRLSPQSSMSVRFNSTGTLLLALRRRHPPALYQIGTAHPVAEFDHTGYYNSCTMKSCCFAGDQDQFVLSGSDDFKLYLWKIPDAAQSHQCFWKERPTSVDHTFVRRAHMTLKDHRSIVNQVRYNPQNMIIASSGVEKIIKLWSAVSLPGGGGALREIPTDHHETHRRMYTYEEYIDLVMESGQFMSHDYSHQSVKEDPRMMAFFDSLVQRDIEGWSSDSSNATATSECLLDTVALSPDCPPSPESATSLGISSPSSDDDCASPPSPTSPSSHTPSPSFNATTSNSRIAQLIVQRRRAQLLRASCLRRLERPSLQRRRERHSSESDQMSAPSSPQPSSSRSRILRLKGCREKGREQESKHESSDSGSEERINEPQETESLSNDLNHNYQQPPHELSRHSTNKVPSSHSRFRRLRDKRRRVLMTQDSSDEDSSERNENERGSVTDIAADSVNGNSAVPKDEKNSVGDSTPIRSNGSAGTLEDVCTTCSNDGHTSTTGSNGSAHFKRLKQGFRNGRSYRNQNSRSNQ